QLWILKSRLHSDIRLTAVLDAKQFVLSAPKILAASFAINAEQYLAPAQQVECPGIRPVAQELQILNRIQASRGSGISGDEYKLAIHSSWSAPLQVVCALDRQVLLIHPEEADVEIVARIFEIIRVASKECCILLGREDQPHIGVFLVAIQMVRAAV